MRLPQTKAGKIALALIVANEIRGIIVVASILWAYHGLPHLQ